MAKRAATWYTAERVARARDRVTRFDWARAERDAILQAAAPIIAISDSDLWAMVPAQSLPRSYQVNEQLGSPISGRHIFSFGRFPWMFDALRHPWKLVDPASGLTFPTNDFGVYYRSGLDHHGEFDPDLADRSLLVNELYPERGPGWGVDDGYGWIDDDGNRWTFIAYYIHWALWYEPDLELMRLPVITGSLNTLREAWLLTGDPVYAHKGIVLLDRIADLYPAMSTRPWLRENGYLASDGWRRRGKIVGSI